VDLESVRTCLIKHVLTQYIKTVLKWIRHLSIHHQSGDDSALHLKYCTLKTEQINAENTATISRVICTTTVFPKLWQSRTTSYAVSAHADHRRKIRYIQKYTQVHLRNFIPVVKVTITSFFLYINLNCFLERWLNDNKLWKELSRLLSADGQPTEAVIAQTRMGEFFNR
jgi:hypothetical protein